MSQLRRLRPLPAALALACTDASHQEPVADDTGMCLPVVDPSLPDRFQHTLVDTVCRACGKERPIWSRGLARAEDGTVYAWFFDTRYGFNTAFYDSDGRQVAYRNCGDVARVIPESCRTERDTSDTRSCGWNGRDLRGYTILCESTSPCTTDQDASTWTVPDVCGLQEFLHGAVPSSCPMPVAP